MTTYSNMYPTTTLLPSAESGKHNPPSMPQISMNNSDENESDLDTKPKNDMRSSKNNRRIGRAGDIQRKKKDRSITYTFIDKKTTANI